jgi:PAS domain S-box-containing protein
MGYGKVMARVSALPQQPSAWAGKKVSGSGAVRASLGSFVMRASSSSLAPRLRALPAPGRGAAFAAGSLLAHLVAAVPHGRVLAPADWNRRHRVVLWILWLHVLTIGAVVMTGLVGEGGQHGIAEAVLLIVPTTLATWPALPRRLRAMFAALGLVSCSAMLVHLSGGYIELHFHFFVVVVLMAVYEDWVPFLAAVLFVLLHHGVLGAIQPTSVYNHPAAQHHPWHWAGIHGTFILALSIVCLAGWRALEAEYERRLAEREAAEEALREGEERFRSALDNAPIGMALVAPDGRFLRVNRALSEIVGYSEADLLARTFQDITHPDDLAADLAFVRQMLDREIRVYQMEKRYLHSDGHEVWVLLSVSLVWDDDGRPRYFVSQIQDVTVRRRMEGELRAAKDTAVEASRLKSIFLSTVSHELRTPMTSIKGYVDLLLDGDVGELTEDQRAFLDIVGNNTRRLTALINDVLDLAKIDAGRLDVRTAPVDLAQAIEQVRAELVPQASAKRIDLLVTVSQDLPPAEADADRLHQVLVNLVGNAVKFTDEGQVTIAARDEGDRLAIEVADTGVGIALEALPHIFDEFRQAESGATRRFGGTGLGLAIAKKLAELQGGTIAVESRPGAGTTFTLTIPSAELGVRREA